MKYLKDYSLLMEITFLDIQIIDRLQLTDVPIMTRSVYTGNLFCF